jgi:hypothetical protein
MDAENADFFFISAKISVSLRERPKRGLYGREFHFIKLIGHD